MKHIHLNYNIQKDLTDALNSGAFDLSCLSEEVEISSITVDKILNGESPLEKEVYEKSILIFI